MGQNTSTNNDNLQERVAMLENDLGVTRCINSTLLQRVQNLEKPLDMALKSNIELQKKVGKLEDEANALGYEIVNKIAVFLHHAQNIPNIPNSPAIASRCGGFLE